MARRTHKQSFAEIVREVSERPAVAEETTGPDLSSGRAKDPSGRVWHRVQDEISAERALDLVQRGASVAYDPCGCGGYCGIDWLTSEQVAQLVAAGPPDVKKTKRRKGWLSEWMTEDGQHLVLAEDAVRWGGLLAR